MDMNIFTLPGLGFELRLKYIKNANITVDIQKILPGKNTQKVNKQKFVFRKIGCLHEVNEIFI